MLNRKVGAEIMLWIKLGWRNLWRNRRRSLIELTSIAGSICIAVFARNLTAGMLEQVVDDGVRMGSGHIGLYRSRYLELRKTEQTLESEELVSALERESVVAAVYPRLHVPALIRSSRDSRSTMILGLDFHREKDSNPILDAKRISAGVLPTDDDERGALMGEILADELGLGVGKKFVVMVQDLDGEIVSRLFKISGLIRTNARMIDAGTIIVPRKVLGDVIGQTDGAHEIAVMLRSHKQIKETLPRLREIARSQSDVDAYPWEDAMPEMLNFMKMKYSGLNVIVLFLYVIVGIGTINTLLMSVMERVREFGVIRAIGLSKRHMKKIVFSEAVVLAVTGVTAGIIIACIGGLYTSTFGIDYSTVIQDQGIGGSLIDPVIYSGWEPVYMGVFGVAMIAITLVASLYPAYYVLKINPAAEMRTY